jgi:hypothetical protein
MSWLITPSQPVPIDPFRSNVSLLLHGDGANGSTTITDSSPTPKSVTAVGNAQISTAVANPFSSSTGVIRFDGTGDYLAANTNAAFGMETSDFTLEAWIRPDLISGSDRGIIDFRNTLGGLVNGGATFIDSTAKLGFYDGVTVYGLTGTAVSLNTWQHIAFVRLGNTLTVYLNGTQNFTASFNVNLGSSRPLGIGGSNTNLFKGSSPFSGYMDEVRITKGVARYTSTFTPPTAPFPDI